MKCIIVTQVTKNHSLNSLFSKGKKVQELKEEEWTNARLRQRWGEHNAQVLEAVGFSRGWLLRATSSTQACQLTFRCTAKIFSFVDGREGRNRALSLLRSANELSKVVTLGPKSSQCLGQRVSWAEH